MLWSGPSFDMSLVAQIEVDSTASAIPAFCGAYVVAVINIALVAISVLQALL